MKVLLTGGGTAGHINPALAIADIILQNAPGSELAFVGIKGGKEEDLVPREGYRLYHVRSMGIRRSLSLANIKALWLAATSPYAKQTTRILDEFKPELVIGTGGYACWPIMSAAARRGIPTALHESNAKPGLAVRQLQKKVDRIWINFLKTSELLHAREKAICVGNPLRTGFGGISKTEARRRLGIPQARTCILSFGGSLGARFVTRAVLELMRDLISQEPGLYHLHAAGRAGYDEAQKDFAAWGLDRTENCVLTDYIYDMPLQMAAADLVISRAGAMTLSELAQMNKAAILIPSPYVADDHQFLNAKTLADAKAAVLVEERELGAGELTAQVKALLDDPARMREMEIRIERFAERDANRKIWQEILTLTEKK